MASEEVSAHPVLCPRECPCNESDFPHRLWLGVVSTRGDE